MVLSPGPRAARNPLPSPESSHTWWSVEVRKKWLCEGLVQRAEHKHPTRVHEIQRVPRERQLGTVDSANMVIRRWVCLPVTRRKSLNLGRV